MTHHISLPQTTGVELFRDIYADREFISDDLSGVLAIGQRLVDATQLQPPLAEAIPGDFSPASEHLSATYLDPEPDGPGWIDSGASLLSVMILPSLEGDGNVIKVGGKLLKRAAEAVEQAAEAPMQALSRHATVKFAQPEHTIAAAYGLGAEDVEVSLTERARYCAFDGMLTEISFGLSRINLAIGKETMLAYLEAQQQYMPDSQSKITDSTVHKTLVEDASSVLQMVHARPEWEQSYTYPHAFTFGPEKFGQEMSTIRLEAPVPLAVSPIDNRVAIRALLRLGGAYDLRDHHFKRAEHSHGTSSIAFEITKSGASAAHTEHALGETLDAQMQQTIGTYLKAADLALYREHMQQDAAAPIAQRDHRLPPTRIDVQRFPA